MSTGLVVAVTIIYMVVGLKQALEGQPGFALMWMSYASANIGLLWAGGAK